MRKLEVRILGKPAVVSPRQSAALRALARWRDALAELDAARENHVDSTGLSALIQRRDRAEERLYAAARELDV